MNYDSINPNKESLTVEILRTFPGYENHTDEQALQVIDSIEKLSKILYIFISSKNYHGIDNQQVVYLTYKKLAA